MTKELLTTADPTVAVTATGATRITGENDEFTTSSSSMSSPSRASEYYFQCAVVVIGVVATITNALVLYALIASKQHKKHVLIVNQNALDLFASFFLTVTYSLRLRNIYLTGSAGYWLCTVVLSGNLYWFGAVGSMLNLAIISIERYLKVVHRTWSKNNLRKRMIYSAAAFAWIGSIIYNLPLVFSTTGVRGGACYAYVIWESRIANMAYLIWNFVSFYVIILMIFMFCYWRILMVIRHQANVMAAHGTAGGSSTASTQSHHRIRTSIIKTMIFVSILFAITWLPNHIYLFIITLNPDPQLFNSGYYSSIFVGFLYICINPFIYATKFDPVKEILLRMIPCKKIQQQANESVDGTGTGNT